MAKTAEKPEAKDEKPAAKKDKPATRPQRVSAKITLTQTKGIEDQFDTAIKRNAALDEKLAEAQGRFADKPDHRFAVAIGDARDKLAESTQSLTDSKVEFEKVGEELRDFFG